MEENRFFTQVSVAVDLEAGLVYIVKVPSAELFDTEDVVAERFDNASRSTLTKAQLFSFKEVFSAVQYIVTFRKVGQFAFAS